MKHVYTIKEKDIGRWHVRANPSECLTCGHSDRTMLAVRDVIGRVLPMDVGKMVYDAGDGVLQVENSEQLEARLALEHWRSIHKWGTRKA